MKTKTNETGKEKDSGLINKKMNRKEALQKTGYIAAATMMILLSTGKAQAGTSGSGPSPETAPSAPTKWQGVHFPVENGDRKDLYIVLINNIMDRPDRFPKPVRSNDI